MAALCIALTAPGYAADAISISAPDAPKSGLHYAVPPPEVIQAIVQNGRPSFRNPVDPAQLKDPLLVYADGGGMANGLRPSQATFSGYYFKSNVGLRSVVTPQFKIENNNPVLNALASVLYQNGAGGSTNRSADSVIEDALNALAWQDQVKNGSYEARLLEIDWIGKGDDSAGWMVPTTQSAVVIWLKSDAGGPDLIYPLHDLPGKKPAARQLCALDEFQEALYAYGEPVPLTVETTGKASFKDAKAAAKSTLDLVGALRQDASFADARTHPALITCLNVLNGEANAVIADSGHDGAASAKLLDEFCLALAQSRSWAIRSGLDANETQADKDKCRSLDKNLESILNQ